MAEFIARNKITRVATITILCFFSLSLSILVALFLSHISFPAWRGYADFCRNAAGRKRNIIFLVSISMTACTGVETFAATRYRQLFGSPHVRMPAVSRGEVLEHGGVRWPSPRTCPCPQAGSHSSLAFAGEHARKWSDSATRWLALDKRAGERKKERTARSLSTCVTAVADRGISSSLQRSVRENLTKKLKSQKTSCTLVREARPRVFK